MFENSASFFNSLQLSPCFFQLGDDVKLRAQFEALHERPNLYDCFPFGTLVV